MNRLSSGVLLGAAVVLLAANLWLTVYVAPPKAELILPAASVVPATPSLVASAVDEFQVSLPHATVTATPTAPTSTPTADAPTATIDGREMYIPELHAREMWTPVATATALPLATWLTGCYTVQSIVEPPPDGMGGAYLWTLSYCPKVVTFSVGE